MIKIAVFASGNGSNAVNLYNYFKNHKLINIASIYCNNPNAGIINKAKDFKIECRIFSKTEWTNGKLIEELKSTEINFIVLAGFLWLVPPDLILNYKNRIINIHPSLLPKYGGKGMYGENVHKAIIENNETISGITIHVVNELYDEGKIIFQNKINLNNGETPETLAERIHELEYKYFPQVIEKYILEEILK
ncbi:MAG: phosphoribosylglycinamide formyltransferase [Bacteroidia bacterium]|nr:phosphoribosylglycinamide formyltransferase [Bacteroidia bacterium]